jgi:hypothetical protein
MMSISERAYTGQARRTTGLKEYPVPSSNVNGTLRRQQFSGGDGFATADGAQTFMTPFGLVYGPVDFAAGLPATKFPCVFNILYPGPDDRHFSMAVSKQVKGKAVWGR